ncbi:hypothetical protein DPMN_023035 [Dreissena polymorpha]|uniref:Uncharacterized protein n=1 Tax=Dreissena polymorpha TaxID=45954 RepID=A0A9D4R9J7_DREPO|nr:hypothetical protein DPMN_023035 [Dreissena polymorpha]
MKSGYSALVNPRKPRKLPSGGLDVKSRVKKQHIEGGILFVVAFLRRNLHVPMLHGDQTVGDDRVHVALRDVILIAADDDANRRYAFLLWRLASSG